eukprot:m.77888 g.77888  ORF g.77888 m.77888 type:complete len:345 (-) comp7933_c0_seq3:210-1244(-)
MLRACVRVCVRTGACVCAVHASWFPIRVERNLILSRPHSTTAHRAWTDCASPGPTLQIVLAPGSDPTLLIAVDWFIVPLLAAQVGMAGCVQYVLKNTLRLLPWYGWYFEQHGCVYVRKDSGWDQAAMQRAMWRLRSQPFWLVIFPEGTRFDPRKTAAISASQQFARANGYPGMHQVLFPRVRGTTTCLATLREDIAAVYDVTVAYCRASPGRPAAPSMADLMPGWYPTIHVFLRRIPAAQIPTGEGPMAKWVIERFVEKDRLLQDFYGSSALTGDGSLAPSWAREASWEHRPCALASWLRTIAWSVMFLCFFSTATGRRAYVALALGGAAATMCSMLPWVLFRI